ncbi:hypothetical protein LOAG_06252 [Loa loa]|uniref:Uncharacterized protein n=1 Tax=Loa loa TaxID=7209 RepID=A0A1I7VS10_LOALO|nr:hypothetical protein LOAG_06252 [Loa loa]EFO22236.1 hypothetical protein LOAG_06252 [Loa loa]
MLLNKSGARNDRFFKSRNDVECSRECTQRYSVTRIYVFLREDVGDASHYTYSVFALRVTNILSISGLIHPMTNIPVYR